MNLKLMPRNGQAKHSKSIADLRYSSHSPANAYQSNLQPPMTSNLYQLSQKKPYASTFKLPSLASTRDQTHSTPALSALAKWNQKNSVQNLPLATTLNYQPSIESFKSLNRNISLKSLNKQMVGDQQWKRLNNKSKFQVDPYYLDNENPMINLSVNQKAPKIRNQQYSSQQNLSMTRPEIKQQELSKKKQANFADKFNIQMSKDRSNSFEQVKSKLEPINNAYSLTLESTDHQKPTKMTNDNTKSKENQNNYLKVSKRETSQNGSAQNFHSGSKRVKFTKKEIFVDPTNPSQELSNVFFKEIIGQRKSSIIQNKKKSDNNGRLGSAKKKGKLGPKTEASPEQLKMYLEQRYTEQQVDCIVQAFKFSKRTQITFKDYCQCINVFLNQDITAQKKLAFNMTDSNQDKFICPQDAYGIVQRLRENDCLLVDDLLHIQEKLKEIGVEDKEKEHGFWSDDSSEDEMRANIHQQSFQTLSKQPSYGHVNQTEIQTSITRKTNPKIASHFKGKIGNFQQDTLRKIKPFKSMITSVASYMNESQEINPINKINVEKVDQERIEQKKDDFIVSTKLIHENSLNNQSKKSQDKDYLKNLKEIKKGTPHGIVMRQNQIAASVKVKQNDCNERIQTIIEQRVMHGIEKLKQHKAIEQLTGYTMKPEHLRPWVVPEDYMNPISFMVKRMTDLVEDPSKQEALFLMNQMTKDKIAEIGRQEPLLYSQFCKQAFTEFQNKMQSQTQHDQLSPQNGKVPAIQKAINEQNKILQKDKGKISENKRRELKENILEGFQGKWDKVSNKAFNQWITKKHFKDCKMDFKQYNSIQFTHDRPEILRDVLYYLGRWLFKEIIPTELKLRKSLNDRLVEVKKDKLKKHKIIGQRVHQADKANWLMTPSKFKTKMQIAFAKKIELTRKSGTTTPSRTQSLFKDDQFDDQSSQTSRNSRKSNKKDIEAQVKRNEEKKRFIQIQQVEERKKIAEQNFEKGIMNAQIQQTSVIKLGNQQRVSHAEPWLYSPRRLQQHIASLEPRLLTDESKNQIARYKLNELAGIPNIVEPTQQSKANARRILNIEIQDESEVFGFQEAYTQKQNITKLKNSQPNDAQELSIAKKQSTSSAEGFISHSSF